VTVLSRIRAYSSSFAPFSFFSRIRHCAVLFQIAEKLVDLKMNESGLF